MSQVIQHAKVTERAHQHRRYQAAQGPARGIAVGLALSTMLWLAMFVTGMHFGIA